MGHRASSQREVKEKIFLDELKVCDSFASTVPSFFSSESNFTDIIDFNHDQP